MLAWFDDSPPRENGEERVGQKDELENELVAGRAALVDHDIASGIRHLEAALALAPAGARQVQVELLLATAHIAGGELARALAHAERAAQLDERADTRERKAAPAVVIARILAAWQVTGLAPERSAERAWEHLEAAILANPRWYDVTLLDPALGALPATRPSLRRLHAAAVAEVRQVRAALDRLIGELGPTLAARARGFVAPLEQAILSESYRELRAAPLHVRRGVRGLEDDLARGFGRSSADARQAAPDDERARREQDRRRAQVAGFDAFFREVGASELGS